MVHRRPRPPPPPQLEIAVGDPRGAPRGTRQLGNDEAWPPALADAAESTGLPAPIDAPVVVDNGGRDRR